MKVNELLYGMLTEEQTSKVDDVIEQLIELLLTEEDGLIGDPIDGSPVSQPTSPPESDTPAPGAPHDPGPYSGIASLWFKTLIGQMNWLFTAKRIKSRMKQVGIKGEGARRVGDSIKIAQANIGRLFSNPGWRQSPMVTMTYGKTKPLNKKNLVPVNKQLHGILAYELKKIPGHIILESLKD